MFRGLTRAMVIVTIALVGVPALMMYAQGGEAWLESLRLMSPMF